VRHTYFIIFLLVLHSLSGQAQGDNFNFINFSSKDGLSASTINAILKDRSGYMWFATNDGLNRFDGTSFTSYRPDPDDTASIGGSSILALYEDHAGNLWIGTDKTLSLYNRKTGGFVNYTITGGTPVRSICGDHSGNLWVGSYSGLFRYDPSTGRSRNYSKGGGRGQLHSNTVLCLYEDSRQRMWIGSNTGLYLYQPATDDFHLFPRDGSDGCFSDTVAKAMVEDRQGRLWIGTNDGGLDLLLPGATKFKNFRHSESQPAGLSSNRIFCIAPDSSGKLWLGTEEGVDIFDPNTARVQRVTSNVRNKFGLQGKSVRSIYIDKNGIYWIGTYHSGVNKYDRNLTFFDLVQSSPFDPYGLSSPKVTSFAEAGNGDIYVGTDDGGLDLFHRRTGLFEHLSLGAVSKPLAVMALEKVGNELWVGTYLQGIFVLNAQNGSVRHYTRGNGPEGLSSNEIFCLHKDRDGNVWVGTNGKGIAIFDPVSHGFKKLNPDTAAIKGFLPAANGFIRSIEEDSTGNIWIGTTGAGVAEYDRRSGRFRAFNRANTGLPIEDAQTLALGAGGVVWVGTSGNGLFRLDVNHRQYTAFGEAQGLANSTVYKIVGDDQGKLWISTNKGISCFDTASRTCKNYTADNGLQRSSYSLGAGLKTSGGEIFFGGLEGFNYFSPSALHYNSHVPTVVFTGLKVAYQNIRPGKNAPIREPISTASEIYLDYKQNFSIDFAVLDYTSPRECQYLYMLDGFDKTWNQIGHSRTAVFTNLDPGVYTLRVKAHNPNDAWTTPSAIMTIFVKPPIWRTTYAYVCYVIAIICLLWGARYRGIRRLKRKFAAEQKLLDAQKRIEDERKEAERQREFDQARIKFLTNLSHEFRTPISLIMGPVDALLNKEPDSQKTEQLSIVKRNAYRLLNLVNQLLDFRSLEQKELRLTPTPGDIVAFAREVAASFKDLADRRQIQYGFNSSLDHFYTSFDKDKIERVLFNLLNNAFKFTGKDGHISLELTRLDDNREIVLTVRDTGAGISGEEQPHIFDRFFQAESNPGIMNQGSGIGLSICKEFVRLHHGSIHVESTYGKGSHFIVRLPLEELPAPAAGPQPDIPAPAGASQPGEAAAVAETTTGELPPPITGTPIILLVEDNDEFRAYLKSHLQPYYRIIEAADGREGWQKALSGHPHVIVSDVSMPHMDGIELSKKIKADKRTSHIPIILLTALTGDANMLAGLHTGASDYLSKPFAWEMLKIKIHNLIQLNQALKDTYSRRLDVATTPATPQSDSEKLLLTICQYIEDNIDKEGLSVEEISKHVFMSRGTLYNKILELTGETPVEFIRSVKLQKAADLLEKTDMKISEIGYAVGFTTPNYFSRAFKAKFNMLPSEYAAQKRKPG
jgi:signal transduction histidine kinase/ligand-binding sensor domain-containing protein/DNA-binding response OmpR family regulator